MALARGSDVLASIDHRFVLICNPKTASTALTRAYRPYANFEVGRSNTWKHISWRGYRDAFGDYFDRHGCVTYAVARHPIDLLGSWWRYRQRDKIRDPEFPTHRNNTVDITFEQFITEWASESPPPRARIFEQRDVLMGDDGSPAPMRYYRYEELARLVAAMNDAVGCAVDVPVVNVSPSVRTDLDLDFAMSLPRFREHVRFYEELPFV